MNIDFLAASERSTAAELWEALESRTPQRHLTASWAWIGTWLKHYGDAVPHRFAIGSQGGQVRAASVLTESTRQCGPLKIRSLHVGTAAEPGGTGVYPCNNGVLADPGDWAPFAQALLRRLKRDRTWDVLVLDRFSRAAVEPFTSAFEGMSTSVDLAPGVDLHAASDHRGDVLATLRPRTRQQVRRSIRELGTVQTEVADDLPTGTSILDELIELHQARWRAEGLSGAFASARFTSFHRDLVGRLLPVGTAMLYRVISEAGTVGCIYNLIDGDVVLSYQQGFGAFANRKVKPGFVSHALCMQACRDRGYAEYSLLPGPAPYKLELSNMTRELISARQDRRSPKLALVAAGRRARQHLRRR